MNRINRESEKSCNHPGLGRIGQVEPILVTGLITGFSESFGFLLIPANDSVEIILL